MPQQLVAKVTLVALVVLVLLSLSSAVNIANAGSMRRLLTHLSDAVTLRLVESSEFDTHTTRALRELQTYILAEEADEIDEAEAAIELAQGDLTALNAIPIADAELDRFAAGHHALNERREAALATLTTTLERVRDHDASDQVVFDEIERIEGEVEDLSADSRALINEERAVIAAKAAERVRQSYLVVASGIGLPLTFLVLGMVALQRTIVRPIRQLAAANVAFAEGRLDGPVPVSSNDEIGVLQRSFNALVTTIRAQTQDLIAQATVADAIRAQARAAEQLAEELAARNAQVEAQAVALQAEITERQLAEQALIAARDAAQEADRAKSAFLATMSHELRTPLTAILGFSQLASQTAREGNHSRIPEDLRYVQSAGKHLLELINDVLDLSRIEAGKLSLSCSTFAVAGLVDEVVKLVQPLAERGGNTFTIRCPPDLGPMYSDETRVRQALLNLLSNAMKFTDGGHVRLSVEAAVDQGRTLLLFAVSDTGPGIAAEQQWRLFQPFSQLDDSTTRKYGGTGLGLALSQRIAHALGGAITVVSQRGAGSTFTLALPVQWEGSLVEDGPPNTLLADEARQEPAGKDWDAQENHTAVHDLIALCIDDDQAFATLLTRMLQSENIAVIHAESGRAGLELAGDVLPDLILLDLRLPDLNGWELLAQLKATPDLAAIPVVLLSIEEPPQPLPTADVVDYLVKPIDQQRLLNAIRRGGFAVSSHEELR